MRRPATLLTLVALAAAATACASSVPPEGAPSSPSPQASATPDATPSDAQPAPSSSGAQAPSAGPSYTAEQAERGHVAFRETCYECHYSSEFKGSDFQFKWGERSVADLYEDISENMPDDDPGSLAPQIYVDVVAYILQLNGFPAGGSELSGDEEAMAAYTLKAPTDTPTR
ncbi:MAG: hypothetical protein PVJ02_00590 [Gemmatimonadota bacterium]|jgi:hypothetical protein